MGYYTGAGVVSGGGTRVSLRSTGPAVGGAYYAYQRVISETTVRNGVSLSTAKAAGGDINLDYWQWDGGMVEPAARGTEDSSSYTQIGDTNLYVLTTVHDVIQVRGKQGTYDSGWKQ